MHLTWHEGKFGTERVCQSFDVALRSFSCCSSDPSPQRSDQSVEQVSWYISLVRVESVQHRCPKHSQNWIFPPLCFPVGLKLCGFILSPVGLLTYTLLLLTEIQNLDSSGNRAFFMILCENLVFLCPPQVFVLVSSPEKWFRNCYSSSETLQDSLLMTGQLLFYLSVNKVVEFYALPP